MPDRSPLDQVKRAASALLDLIYPPRCSHCGRIDWRWCPQCHLTLESFPLSLRLRTFPGLPIALATGAHAGVLRDAVHALKYEGALDVAEVLAARAVAALYQHPIAFDLIVPVPLSIVRWRERGYNQSEVIGAHMAALLNQPLAPPEALVRWRATPPQVGRSRLQRQVNVSGAFTASARAVTAARVVLLDDVMTSGATLQECAAALVAAGARSVSALTIAEAPLTHNVQ